MPSSPKASTSGRLRRILFTGVAVVASIAAAGSALTGRYFHAAQATAGAAAPEQAVAVTVAVVEPRQAHLWDDFSGRLEAVDRVELRPRVAGAILSTNFSEGALVKAGDLLFKIDPAPYAAEVDKAQAQLEAAQARVVFTTERARAWRAARRQRRRHPPRLRRARQRQPRGDRQRARPRKRRCRPQSSTWTTPRCARPVDGRVGKIEVTVGNLVAAGPGVAGADVAGLGQSDLRQLRCRRRGRCCGR